MAERRNGSFPYQQPKHGSDQRGVVAVPRGRRNLNYLKQSQEDKNRLLEIARRRREETNHLETGYGNKNLPAYAHKQEIIELIDNYKAVILGGPTGSGKSTQVPQFLLEAGYDKIYMMVPRRIIADGLHERLIEELTPHLGEESALSTVGVVHGERSEVSDDNRIVVMTPNTYLRMEKDIRARYEDKKVAIIADEVHEANIYTEIATGAAAESVDELDSWRLIAASATHNVGSLQSSFSLLNNGYVPEVNILGRPFEVEVRQAEDKSAMDVYAEEGADHEVSMIFTSGKAQIEHIIRETKNKVLMDKGDNSVVFRILHADLNDLEKAHLRDPVPEGSRLVIVATPAGMSGITIPDVSLVVTDGTINRQRLDKEGILGLVREYLSQAEIMQEFGRAGRTKGGAVGILASPTVIEEDKIRARGQEVDVERMPFLPLDQRDLFGPPEIYNSNLSQVVLTVASLDRKFEKTNKYIQHPVEPTDIISAEESLARIGALDDEDRITAIGTKMSAFPIRPELSRGLVEAMQKGRSIQQLSRLALICAGVEAGGVQDYRYTHDEEWRKLLRFTTHDDMMAQLDILTAEMPKDRYAYLDFLTEQELNFKRTERALKVSKKILREFGIRRSNIVHTPPSMVEEDELRADLTAGMIDLIYQQDTEIKHPHYRNIHGDSHATPRDIGGRSLVPGSRHEYIAGFPRWFVKQKQDGSVVKYDVVELAMPVDSQVVADYAIKNELVQYSRVQPHLHKGEVVEMRRPMFGSIPAGKAEVYAGEAEISKESQNMLVEHVLKSPGSAQIALRELAEELEQYTKRVPEERLKSLLRDDAPEFITKKTIRSLVQEAAKSTRRAYEIDRFISEYIFHENIGIHRYFDDEGRKELQDSSPSGIVLNGNYVQIHYHQTEPYITLTARLPRNQNIFLPDGREVKVRITRSGKSTYYHNTDLAIAE